MIILKKKNVIIAVFIVVIISFMVCLGGFMLKPIETSDKNNIKIVIDAGHGGIDGGVVGVDSKVKESELNLKVTFILKELLEASGFSVVLTRNSDAGLYGVATGNLKKKDMQKRKEIINSANANMVISIHMNNYSVKSRRGAQVFYKKGDEKSLSLANSIQQSFNSMEEATRNCEVLSGDYYILNCSNIPSVICECGFLSNSEDDRLLNTESYREKISYSIFKGIVEYLSISSGNIFEN